MSRPREAKRRVTHIRIDPEEVAKATRIAAQIGERWSNAKMVPTWEMVARLALHQGLGLLDQKFPALEWHR